MGEGTISPLEDKDVPWLVSLVKKIHKENITLRKGLQQIADLDYPAEAGEPQDWAKEILARPESVDWEDEVQQLNDA